MGFPRTRCAAVLATSVAVLLAVTACSSPSTEGATPSASGPPASSAPSSSPSAEVTVDFGTAPAGDGTPDCSALLPAAAVDAVVPGARAVALADVPHVAAADWAPVVAGGSSCTSTTGVAPLDGTVLGTIDDPRYEGVRVTVLPDATAEYQDLAASGLTGVLDGGPSCSASDAAVVYCVSHVLVGDAWVQVLAQRVQDDPDTTEAALDAPFRALVEQVGDALRTSPVTTARVDEHVDGSLPPCVADNVDAVTDTTLRWALEGTDVAPTTVEHALDRLAGASCGFVAPVESDPRYDQQQAQYDRLPNGGWAVEQRLAAGTIDRDGRIDLDGLEDGAGAWRTCDDTACTLDVVSDGGTWEHFVLMRAVAPDTAEAVERWATASRG